MTGDPAPRDTVEYETLPGCPLCGSTQARDWVEGFDRMHRVDLRRFTYRICRECALVYLSPRPTAESVHAFYPTSYGPYHSPPSDAAKADPPVAPVAVSPANSWTRPPRWLRRTTLPVITLLNRAASFLLPDRVERRLKRFYEPWGKDLTLLDFGCGSDKFLNQARKRSWKRTIGIDFSPDVVARVQASGHQGYVNGAQAWQAIAPASVHLARLNHALEHVYDPQAVLTHLIERLAPEGRLHLALPNPASLTSSLFKSCWFGLECPRHVMLYSPERARRLVESVGFRQVELLHETLTKDFARSLGYTYVDRGELDPDHVEPLVHDEFLHALGWLPARLAALMGRADRFHVLALR